MPLVIHGPGIPARRERQQAQGIDLFPTLGGLLGFPLPPNLPGRDLFLAATDRPVFSETRFGDIPTARPTSIVSVRTARWKLIHAPAFGYSELYDLAHDPRERRSHDGRAPEGAVLAGLLAAWTASARAPPPPAGHDPAHADKLRALGYVQ